MKILTKKRNKNQYLFNDSDFISLDEINGNEDLCFPVVTDSEFAKDSRKGVTVQCLAINLKKGTILAHPDQALLAEKLNKPLRHPVFTSGFALFDYLKLLGLDVKFYRRDEIIKKHHEKTLPVFEFVSYSHYALAEFYMIVTGDCKRDFLSINFHSGGRQVHQKKRLFTNTEVLNKQGNPIVVADNIELNWHLRLNNHLYRIKFTVIDTFALHGVASYKDLSECTGVNLKYKDNLSLWEKQNMDLTYFNNPKLFDNYALGDLEVYSILANNAQLFRLVWKALEIEGYYRHPKLTIGSTVADLFRGKLYSLFELHPEDLKAQKQLIKLLCFKASASYLKYQIRSTACLNAKVFGGRCRNNRPNVAKLEGAIVDLDIFGAYGEGQRNQLYPIGNPILEDYEADSRLNQYLTLRQWLKQRKFNSKKCELVPGLWQAFVSSSNNLKTPQDFLISWFDFRYEQISRMPTDCDTYEAEIKPKTGITKIFNYQVLNSIITHDFLDWLFFVASPSQRNELLDNLYILTAIYYPSYARVESPQELLKLIDSHQGKNVTISKRRPRKKTARVIKTNEEPCYWYAIDLGKFLIDDLLAWRKMYPKEDSQGKKVPMNTLFKLCINTLYGDFVSPYFDISNVIVGNNITARCRAMAWYTEKGLHGVLTITDGGPFDLNNVVYPSSNKRRVTAANVINLHREKDPKRKNLKLKPIDHAKNIELSWYKEGDSSNFKFLPLLKITTNNEKTKFIKNPERWIDNIALLHLQNTFPNVSVLHAPSSRLVIEKSPDETPIKHYEKRIGQFEFETKALYNVGLFHGSANYCLIDSNSSHIAMRSYESNKDHDSLTIKDGQISTTSFYSDIPPSEFFLNQLQHPDRISRSKVFKKKSILKINDFRQHRKKWLLLNKVAGDTIDKIGLLREFSLSQFTFNSLLQYDAINKEVARNKRRYQQSYEGYFINDDLTLNFALMIATIDLLLSRNINSINDFFDRHDNRHRQTQIINHPEAKNLIKIKELLYNIPQQDPSNDNFDDDEDWENLIFINENNQVLTIFDDDRYCLEAVDATDEDIDFDFC